MIERSGVRQLEPLVKEFATALQEAIRGMSSSRWTTTSLFAISMGIVALRIGASRVRLFVRSDPYKRFVSCLVFVPRDRYNTDNRERIAAVLRDAFGATEIDWALRLSDSKLARIHYIRAYQHSHGVTTRCVAAIERRGSPTVSAAGGPAYLEDRPQRRCMERSGAMPCFAATGQRSRSPIAPTSRARAAVPDIDRARSSCERHAPYAVNVYRPSRATSGLAAVRSVPSGPLDAVLGDVLPVLENMGLEVRRRASVRDRPRRRAGRIWLYDFGASGSCATPTRTRPSRSRKTR